MTYSTYEAAERAGVTYRMLDYWLRTGAVRIKAKALPGSGHQRRFTEDEVETLCAVVKLYRAANEVLRDFGSGLLWEIAAIEQEATDVERAGSGRAAGDAGEAAVTVRGRAPRGRAEAGGRGESVARAAYPARRDQRRDQRAG